jgi:hypothetical protein
MKICSDFWDYMFADRWRDMTQLDLTIANRLAFDKNIHQLSKCVRFTFHPRHELYISSASQGKFLDTSSVRPLKFSSNLLPIHHVSFSHSTLHSSGYWQHLIDIFIRLLPLNAPKLFRNTNYWQSLVSILYINPWLYVYISCPQCHLNVHS